MNKTILFSPIGGTDPISNTNCRDGSMLHICRVYKPDIVYMYMSYEILEYQKKDDRYRYCLDELAKKQGHLMEYKIIERPDLKNVQNFDYFYTDFREIICKIQSEMDDSDKLLLNISSGTPAMKSGLLVLATLGEFPYEIIQVSTPERSINEHSHKNYDVKDLWELNEDNNENFENRCESVKCPTLSLIKKEEIIKNHISAFNYSAALDVAKTMPEEKTKKYFELLEMGHARLLLDYGKSEMIGRTRGMQCFPVNDKEAKKYFEYALNLDVKIKKKEYADFIRGITPIVVDVFELLVKDRTGIDIGQYCSKDSKNVRKWDLDKLDGTELGNFLNTEYHNGFHGGPIYSDHLRKIIIWKSEDNKLKELVTDLRNVEGTIRNLAAHEIVCITDEVIKEKTNFTANDIMKKIKCLFKYTNLNIKKEYWDAYKNMNNQIVQVMERV